MHRQNGNFDSRQARYYFSIFSSVITPDERLCDEKGLGEWTAPQRVIVGPSITCGQRRNARTLSSAPDPGLRRFVVHTQTALIGQDCWQCLLCLCAWKPVVWVLSHFSVKRRSKSKGSSCPDSSFVLFVFLPLQLRVFILTTINASWGPVTRKRSSHNNNIKKSETNFAARPTVLRYN